MADHWEIDRIPLKFSVREPVSVVTNEWLRDHPIWEPVQVEIEHFTMMLILTVKRRVVN